MPIRILMHMNNSAGIFQIQEILSKKIIDSLLKNYVEVIAITKPDEPIVNQRIIHQLVIKGRKFQALE